LAYKAKNDAAPIERLEHIRNFSGHVRKISDNGYSLKVGILASNANWHEP